MTPVTSSVAHDTDAKSATSTGTKSHMLQLDNDLNITNAVMSFMAPSASYNRIHGHICAKDLVFPSNVTKKPDMSISSHAHMKQLCQYASYEPTAIKNVTKNPVYIHFTFVVYTPETIYLPHHTYATLHYYYGLCTPHTAAQTNPNTQQSATFNYHVIAIYVFQQGICPSNTTSSMPISLCADMTICQHIYLI